MADLPSLKRKRATCRSWLTRVISNANVILQKDDVIYEQLQLAYQDVTRRLETLSAVQDEIEMLIEESELESDIDESSVYLQSANEVMARVTHRLAVFNSTVAVTDDAACVGEAAMGYSQGYLPKIDIGKFDGDFSSFQSFFDKFTALIDNTNLAEISKFTYLQSFLEGDAKKAIEGLSLTQGNYKVALDILKSRFGRKERIVHGHVQNLLAVDFQNSLKNVKDLWNNFNELQSNIRCLKTLGVNGDNYGLVLTPLIVSRLPPDMRLMWARKSHEKEADLDFLMTFLQGEIEDRERSQSFVHPPNNTNTSVTPHRDRDKRPLANQDHKFPYQHQQQQRHSGAGGGSRGPRATSTGIALNNSVAGRESRGHRATRPGSSWTTFGAGRESRGPKATESSPEMSTSAMVRLPLCVFCSGGHRNDECRAVFRMNIDDVRVKIKENQLCFVCLQKGHQAKKCYSTCQICKGKHNELFCDANKKNTPETEISDTNNVSAQSHTYFQNSFSDRTTVLQTLSVKVNGIDMNLLFDSGSDKSFITSKAVQELKPPFVGRETIRMSGFGSKQPSVSQVRNVYDISFQLDDRRTQRFNLTEVDSISATLHKPKIPIDLLTYFSPQCKFSCDINTNNNVKIDILIGQDYYWQLIDANQTIQSPSGLVAQRTRFGLWLLSGAYQEVKGKDAHSTCRQFVCLNEIPEPHFRKLWDLDYLECGHDNQNEPMSMSKVLIDFEEKITHKEGRYEVSLPWAEGKKHLLQDNAKEALSRLGSLEKKLSKDETLKESYNKIFQHMEEGGIIEEVSSGQSEGSGPVFYLPHRPVVKSSSSTTKIRPVFDASAKGPNGVSLNDCMETGPNLLPLLSDILIRFRRHKVAISADIEKAFLQVSVRPEERDVHRFFWKVDGTIRTMRIKRVPFGNKSSPFLLNATVRHHLSSFGSESRVVQELSENMYVDDWLSGGDSDKEALSMMSEASEIMSKAGMKLTKWSSNSLQIAENSQISFQDKSTGIETVKVLGIKWIPGADALTFDCMVISPEILITKRVILSCIAKIFDPLGLISPFVVSIRILFQEVWKLGLSWDDQVPDDIGKRFLVWTRDLIDLQELSFSRSYVTISWKEKRGVELHCFCDASLKAYGAVVYIKVFEADGSVTISLVLSKTKVAPLKPVTLPRLELLGAFIGARLVHSVRSALQLPDDVKYYCWTDSTVALQWIKSDPTKWKMFVCNRVVQIQDVTTPECWFHCIGKENPADLLTRGLTSRELLNSALWFYGPPWLDEFNMLTDANINRELSTGKLHDVERDCEEEVISTTCFNRTQTSDEVLDTKRWGDFSKAVRVVGWIFRFANNSRCKTNREKSFFLKTEELKYGKQKLLWYIQHEHFAAEIHSLSIGQQVKKDSVLHKMRPFLDENGILRMSGRLQLSDLSFEDKHPIILPKCHLTFLMVRREHQRLKHAGVPLLMATLRNQFWIIGLRSFAKRVKRKCLRCQRFDSLPCTQTVSPLPQERLTRASPFSITGLDFAGPVYTADMVGKKFYILIFTCGVTRAIHIELCESLSLTDFRFAFRRFVSRRGMPSKIWSDNAKTFHAAAKEITQNYAEDSVKWVFNAPKAPWRGGIWERLVRSVKQSLKKTIGNRLLTRVELETILIEIEFCINSRPLTYLSDDPECSGVLSPSHFLIGRSDGLKPLQLDVSNVVPGVTGKLVRDSYRHTNEQLEKFWKMWQMDYIRNLPYVKSSPMASRLVEGSVVILNEDNCPRLSWPLGKVARLLPGRDGVVRTVEVKTAKGKLIRAVQRVHSLELDSAEDCNELCEEESCVEEAKTKKRSSLGRLIKPPNRLDL